MEEDMIINGDGDEIVIPNVADTAIPLTPDVPVDVEPTVGTGDIVTPEGFDLNSVGEFFGTIQESITISWRYHLKTNKHRVHVALNEYYDDALKKVDSIIEQYQGITGTIVENYINSISDGGKTETEYFQELKSFVEGKKTSCGFSDELISTIEDYQGLIDSTLYKLTSFTERAVKSFEEFCFEDYDVIGAEGGVDGVFDNITKTTKENVAPSGATENNSKKCKKCKDKDCDCTDSESKDDEEEE